MLIMIRFFIILEEHVAIKAIDMKKFADLSSREMLDFEV